MYRADRFQCKLVGHVFAAGILVAACTAQPLAQSSAVPPGVGGSGSCTVFGGGQFADLLFFLKPGFDPVTIGRPQLTRYSPPESAGAVSEPYRSDLIRAFDEAPSFLQRRLCHLDAVFINQQPQSPDLGIWENVDQRASDRKARTYVILSDRWWHGPGHTLVSLSEHEALLNAPFEKFPHMLKYSSPQDSDRALTLISALAHEDGHIVQYSEPLQRDVCRTLDDGAESDIFLGSWSKVSWPGRFHFAEQSALKLEQSKVINGPSYDTLAESIVTQNDGGSEAQKLGGKVEEVSSSRQARQIVMQNLRQIYSNGMWFSLFATVAPDEDFAETYKALALQTALNPLTSLSVQVADTKPIDVLAPAAGGAPTSILARKERCLADNNPSLR